MRPSGIRRADWLLYNLHFVLEHCFGYSRSERHFGARKRALFARIDRSLEGSARGTICEVEPVGAGLSSYEFQQRSRSLAPLVFRGAAADWSSTRRWSLDFLETRYGDRVVLLNDNAGLVDRANPQEFATLPLGRYIRMLKAGSLSYLKFSRLVDDEPELKNDLDLAWLRRFRLPGSFREETYAFIGGRGTRTPIHCGFSGSLFTQIAGRKKWFLYAPEERLFLDARTDRTFYFYSDADPGEPHAPAYPLLRYARQYEITLEPGDVLWVPPFAWHQVENPTHSIGLSYRFNCIPAALRSSKALTALLFASTRPNVLHHFLVTMLKRQAYIFTRPQSALGTGEAAGEAGLREGAARAR